MEGICPFDHAQASANLYAHAILTPRARLTSDMAVISWRLTLPQPRAHAAVREKAQPLSSSGGVVNLLSASVCGRRRKVTAASAEERLLQEREREEKLLELMKQCEQS